MILSYRLERSGTHIEYGAAAAAVVAAAVVAAAAVLVW
jgi:hypothetical protein